MSKEYGRNKHRNNRKSTHGKNNKRYTKRKNPARSYRNSNYDDTNNAKMDKNRHSSNSAKYGQNRTKQNNGSYNHQTTKSFTTTTTRRQNSYRTSRDNYDNRRSQMYDKAKIDDDSYNDNSYNDDNDMSESFDILREQLFEILGGHVCSGCGFRDKRALGIASKYGDVQFDSINKKVISSWSKYVENTDLAVLELVVLCLNCNRIREPISRSITTSYTKKNSHKQFPR